MPCSRDRVPAIKIEVALAIARIDPNAFAAFGYDGHLLVRSELKLLFEVCDFFKACHHEFSPQRTQSRSNNQLR